VVIADVLRFYSAGASLLLVLVCIYCLYPSSGLDQRIRFGSLALLGVVITSGQVANLGEPGTWRLPLLATAVTLAVIGSGMFVRADRRARSGGE
jgi:hypothetical protein